MKTKDEYFLDALSKVGQERHGNKPGPIVLTVYSTGHAQAICNAALDAQWADFKTLQANANQQNQDFLKWILQESIDGDLHIEDGCIIHFERDEEGAPIHPNREVSYTDLLTIFKKHNP